MMNKENWTKVFEEKNDWTVETAAMLLALTWNQKLELEVKKILNQVGFKYVVTEIGGVSFGEFQGKTTKAVLGACWNNNLIKKIAHETHAVLHATEEAKRGLMVNASSSTSIAVKVAIVRDKTWVAVAMFGQSAIHPMTNHQRAGLGVMHIAPSDDLNL